MSVELAGILVAALLLDRALGEPPNAFHPTAYLGRGAAFLTARLKDSKLHGAVLYLAVAVPFSFIGYAIAALTPSALGVFLGAVLLKLQFSWRGLWDHASPVAELLLRGDLVGARRAASLMVGRDTSTLDERHVVSACVESVGESSVDGIAAPLFYYALFGLVFGAPYGIAAAAFYRATNTLDSMVGYRKPGLSALGFFSARMDDLLSYLPARLSAVLLIASAFVLRTNWRKAVEVYLRDRKNTPSPNSGHTMAAVAGALGVRLEKLGFYTLGDRCEELRPTHIRGAMSLVNVSTLLAAALTSSILWGVP